MKSCTFNVSETKENGARPKGALHRIIRENLSKTLDISINSIITQENKEKYSSHNVGYESDNYLKGVFNLMLDLNKTSMNDPLVASDPEGREGFAATLEGIVDEIAKGFKLEPLVYVELGPEPIKTEFIMSRLIEKGVRIESYVSVDINPKSENEMKSTIKKFLPEDKIFFINKSFEKLNSSDFQEVKNPIIVTMLGFQEGNDLPQDTALLLQQILRPGDMVVSEMQISCNNRDHAFKHFYRDPRMREFSRIALQRTLPGVTSQYRICVVNVEVEPGEIVPACVMYEDILDGPAAGKIFVTNYCLKPSVEQFERFRASAGFSVKAQRITGDGAVAFQLAEASFVAQPSTVPGTLEAAE